MFEYPKTDLDVAEKVRSLTGGYWIDIYEGKDQIEDLVDARTTLWKDAMSVWKEAELSKSRLNISPFKSKSWIYFPILKSEGIANRGFYEGGAEYGSSVITYGEAVGFSWKLPDGVASVSQIYNRISYPSASLFEGIDFSLNTANNRLVFSFDPFLNTNFATRDKLNSNGVQDRELAMWLYLPKIDQKSVQQIYGLPIGVDGQSGEAYKGLVNTIYDCLILGMSSGRLSKLLGYALNAPVADTTETVEAIHSHIRKVVVTNKRVYFLSPRSEPTVSVGDEVSLGQSLSNALVVKELRRGSDLSEVKAITLGKGFINNEFSYDLTFLNDDTPVDVDDKGPVTELKFKVSGHPFDVDRFWEIVHANGVKRDRTIAMGLDLRADKVGNPYKESLPSTINPLQFLINEIIPGGLTLVTIKAEAVPQGIPRLDVVPDLVSLGNGVFFIFEAPLAIDSAFTVQSSNEDKYTGAETLEEYDASYLLNSAVVIKSISSQCS